MQQNNRKAKIRILFIHNMLYIFHQTPLKDLQAPQEAFGPSRENTSS
jgi:hypothetical protein